MKPSDEGDLKKRLTRENQPMQNSFMRWLANRSRKQGIDSLKSE